ncbi:MAG TPA: glutamate formimidoyltransferase [Candidatus Dormibacteraeota bacterium]|nr:glutamate formimidoyltransferase [Candidatus Dormibacteraeota bacterium]
MPNVSEGRRAEVIQQLVAAVEASPGCCLLDVHSDPDHNRSVLTFAGAPAAVQAGALALAREAIRLVDLRGHQGVHPRIGAIDVIPFVPLVGAGIELCVNLAREVAAAIAAAHDLPVYLYGDAAPAGEARTLAGLRAGGFEALVAGGLRLDPDFGPRHVHPSAGALAVGARGPLIAFNVLLDSADVAVARQVARSVRESSGGLPGVQALGLFLPHRGAAQVSMNLVDFRRTSLADLLQAVRASAEQRGAHLLAAELVGIAPAAALDGLNAAALPGMPDQSSSIESRLATCAG